MAEAVFAEAVKRNDVQDKFGKIDSCGTADYHEGEEPDLRCVGFPYLGRRVCARKTTSPSTALRVVSSAKTLANLTIFLAWSMLLICVIG